MPTWLTACPCIDEHENGNGTSRVVEGIWLDAELLTWGGLMDCTGTFQVGVVNTGVDPHTPSNGTQPTRPDKEQLWLAVLHAARESWLQALGAAGLALRARQVEAKAARLQAEREAAAQASTQALLGDLRRAGDAVHAPAVPGACCS